VVPAYRAPRPIDIDTADIDVTTPRKRTDRISRDRNDPQQGTIKRGRTVVRLHTKRLKENPGLQQNRRKTPGEKLVEKFLIRDKAAEQAKYRKHEQEAGHVKHVNTGSGILEAENRGRVTSGRENGLTDLNEPRDMQKREKKAADEEKQDVVNVTQSEALDILLSETMTTPALAPEHSPSATSISLKDEQEESHTVVHKRPKKRDKGSTIKRVPDVQTPVEKSLLQRRNTVKRLRRNSRDIEVLLLDISDNETSVPSTNTGPLPLSASSLTSTQTASAISSPVESVPSTTLVPTLEFDPKIEEVKESAVTKPECSNRDVCPLKTKVSGGKSERNISRTVSVDVSVENADDILKKMPFRFVIDEIKVEETPKSPKSPKLVHYEVTVEEVLDKKLPFQKDTSKTLTSDTCSVINDVSSTQENVQQVNVTVSLGNSCNEQVENKGTVTAAHNMATTPSVSDTSAKIVVERGSKPAQDNEGFIVPKCETKIVPIKQVQNMKDTLNNSVTIDEKGMDRHKVHHKDKTENGSCNKFPMDSSRVAERDSSSHRSEITLPTDQKNKQSHIPAWKKALIEKSKASNVSKSEDLVNFEHKRKQIKLISESQIPNNNIPVSLSINTSGNGALKPILEPPSKQDEAFREEKESPTKSCSEISEQQQVGKTKTEGADIMCGNYTQSATELKPDVSETGTQMKIEESKSKGNEKQKSEEGEMRVNSFGKAAAESETCELADIIVNKGKVVENKLICGGPLHADKVETADTKPKFIKTKNAAETVVGKTKPTEASMEENKLKPVITEEMKPAERKVKDSKLKDLLSSPVQTMPPEPNVTECKVSSLTSVTSERAETELFPSKLKYVETLPVEEGPKTKQSSITKPASIIGQSVGKTVNADIKPVDKTTSVRKSSVEMIKCTESEVPSTVPGSEEERKEAGNSTVQMPDSNATSLNSECVEISGALKSGSVGKNSKLGKTLSVETETEIVETKPSEKKSAPLKEEVLNQRKFSGTSAVEKEKACDSSVVPEVTAEPQSADEDEETDDDDDDDDDGEDMTVASSSSSEDSGFDSIPTSVPGSPACYKKCPASKGIHPIF
jgi:hypothetical protein